MTRTIPAILMGGSAFRSLSVGGNGGTCVPERVRLVRKGSHSAVVGNVAAFGRKRPLANQNNFSTVVIGRNKRIGSSLNWMKPIFR